MTLFPNWSLIPLPNDTSTPILITDILWYFYENEASQSVRKRVLVEYSSDAHGNWGDRMQNASPKIVQILRLISKATTNS